MKKLDQVDGNVSMSLDNLLPGVRGDLVHVRTDPDWEFQARGKEYRPRSCTYCGDVNHKASECQNITDVDERKRKV